MLMRDMTESERETVRKMNDFWTPDGAELVELFDATLDSVGLFRMPDGEMKLKVLGEPDHPDVIQMLADKISLYERLQAETERFRGIARVALGLQRDDDRPWYCGTCGTAFADSQPHCPACGHHAQT
jgi:rubrerythrin